MVKPTFALLFVAGLLPSLSTAAPLPAPEADSSRAGPFWPPRSPEATSQLCRPSCWTWFYYIELPASSTRIGTRSLSRQEPFQEPVHRKRLPNDVLLLVGPVFYCTDN